MNELVILLNQLYRDELRSFTVNDPFFGSEIFKIVLNRNVTVKVINQYEVEIGGQKVSSEMPPGNAHADILVQSGMVKYKNWDWVFGGIQKKSKWNPLAGDRLIFFCFDTNLFLDRFFTRMKDVLTRDEYKHVGFVIPDVIKDELNFGNKYSKKEALFKSIEQHLSKNGFSASNFVNQPKLMDRKRYLGHQELFKMQKFTHCELIHSARGTSRDDQILKTLVKFSSERNVDITIFSRDKDFDKIRGYSGIEFVKINRIYDSFIPEKINTNWGSLCELIYVSAITFGGIKLVFDEKDTINACGIWSGKGPLQWEKEQIKLESGLTALSNAIIDFEILRESEKKYKGL